MDNGSPSFADVPDLLDGLRIVGQRLAAIIVEQQRLLQTAEQLLERAHALVRSELDTGRR